MLRSEATASPSRYASPMCSNPFPFPPLHDFCQNSIALIGLANTPSPFLYAVPSWLHDLKDPRAHPFSFSFALRTGSSGIFFFSIKLVRYVQISGSQSSQRDSQLGTSC